jgi:DNA glycosylase AlkZ-like
VRAPTAYRRQDNYRAGVLAAERSLASSDSSSIGGTNGSEPHRGLVAGGQGPKADPADFLRWCFWNDGDAVAPIVDLQQVNRYLWDHQGLDLRHRRGIFSSAKRLPGLFGSSPTCYLSLLARVPDGDFTEIDRELYVRKRLVRIRAMRSNLFLVPQQMLPATFQATAQTCQTAFRELVENAGVSQRDYLRVADRISQILERKCLTVSETKKALSTRNMTIRHALSFIVSLMCAEGRLVRARARGGWTSDLGEYTDFHHWLPRVDLTSVTPAEGRTMLARAYFEAFGPATAIDFQWWSGFTKAETGEVLDALNRELTTLEIRGLSEDFLMPLTQVDRLRATPNRTPARVALLPQWDAYLMGYRNRERFLSRRWSDRVYDRNGNATSAVISEGRVAGVWDWLHERHRLIVKVAMFQPATDETLESARAAATRMTRAVGARETMLRKCRPPAALGSNPTRLHSPLHDRRGEVA